MQARRQRKAKAKDGGRGRRRRRKMLSLEHPPRALSPPYLRHPRHILPLPVIHVQIRIHAERRRAPASFRQHVFILQHAKVLALPARSGFHTAFDSRLSPRLQAPQPVVPEPCARAHLRGYRLVLPAVADPDEFRVGADEVAYFGFWVEDGGSAAEIASGCSDCALAESAVRHYCAQRSGGMDDAV